MHIKRYYHDQLPELLQAGRVLALYGPRRSGKTTLLNELVANFSGKYFFCSGEDRAIQEVFISKNINIIKNSFASYDLVVIDEAQAILDIGLGLKMLVDHLPNVKVIASGSSSFELASHIGEPLTGRKRTLTLFPVSSMELASNLGNMALRQRLEELLIYGSYPEILTTSNFADKVELLIELRDAYLFKDILALDKIRNAGKLHDLLTMLALQVGKEVSLSELGGTLGMSKQTVERYLDLLEKTFVIRKLSGFSRNLRKEVTKTCHYYFYDNGILNAVINNFNFLKLRNDVGALWENFLFTERLKKQTYCRIHASNYFWRTYDQQEIDLVEERNGKLFAYEFKYSPKKTKVPVAWRNAYENSEYKVISKENFLEFIL
jgi:predicted AAA+ superfamily ATPase